MNPRWFWRMAKWGRNPPSQKRVKRAAIILAICLVLVGIERLFGWPDWATVQRLRP